MSSPRHSPPPSAAAPRPKGILKNASDSGGTLPLAQGQGQEGGKYPEVDENGNRLAWDESNLTLHEIERESQAARMKIDEPKTPFVRSASLVPMDEDSSFDLDSQGGPSYFPSGSSGTTASGSSNPQPTAAASPTVSGGRRSSAAEQLAANTMANAGRRPSNAGSATSSGGGGGGGGSQPSVAVGLDSVEMAAGGSGSNSRRSDSRSPSFTLPTSRRSSATGERSREGVREEMRNRDDAMEGVERDEDAFGEDENEALDPEAKAKQAAFAQKRNAHYGNEAEAMKVAAALAAQEDDDEDDDEDDALESGTTIPPVPSLPNGRAM